MRLIGLKSAMLAAGLMLAGAGHAAPQAARTAAPPAAAATAQRRRLPHPLRRPRPPATPAPAATPAADPEMLAMDGAPAMVPVKGIGDAVDGDIGIQPQVTKNGERAADFHDAILVPVIIVDLGVRADPAAVGDLPLSRAAPTRCRRRPRTTR